MLTADEGAQDLVVAKDSDDVTAVQSALPQEVNEPPSTVKTVNPISLTLSSTPTKSPACKKFDMNVAPTIVESKEAPKAEAIGDYSGKFDFESDESTEDEAVDEASSELQDNREGSEEDDSDDDSAEGESSEEEDSDDDMTEGESSEDEDITEGESSEDEAGADGSEKHCAQKSLIVENADVSKAAEVAKATHLPALAAAHVEEGFAAMTQTSSPLPANLATQFPRPTSAKSSGKKQSKYIYDDNEESLDTSKEVDKDEDLEGVEMEKHDEDITEKEEDTAESFEAKSLRQLKKMLKHKLNIVDSKNDTSVVDKPRIALKEVPENQMAVNEN